MFIFEKKDADTCRHQKPQSEARKLYPVAVRRTGRRAWCGSEVSVTAVCTDRQEGNCNTDRYRCIGFKMIP